MGGVSNAETSRTPTAIDQIAETYVHELVKLVPTAATAMGIAGYDDQLPDYSPDGLAALAQLRTDTLAKINAEDEVDDIDRVTKAAMNERLGIEQELYEADEFHRDLNVIASPAQDMREVFTLMATETVADYEHIAKRMAALPAAVASYEQSLREAKKRGHIAPLRQVEAVIKQADDCADVDHSLFSKLVKDARIEVDGHETALPGALQHDLADAANDARQAFADLAQFLAEELALDDTAEDAVGRERYERFSRYFLGAKIDLDETYAWGEAELERIIAEQQRVAHELYGDDCSIEAAMAHLDKDPNRTLAGTAALQRWMQQTSDQAIADLNGTQFDIPGPLQRLECMIAPTQTGGIYYTGPADDFSRAGRMWWSVPAGVKEFSTWREKTTVYHEGVPGHHLQVGHTVYRRDILNLWRRQACWVSGHGEGWALYAERLMEELGYLDDLGDKMGMLDAQRLRAARVVLDIGVHLEKDCPEQWGGGVWDAEKAWKFLQANANMDRAFLAFELDRYLGWPGQAPSYKVGQRLWEEAREQARQRAEAAGESFDLPAFHRRALDLGGIGLDLLQSELARQ